MSSPIALITEGIQAGDWQKVCDGFAGLTGQKLEPPSVVVPTINVVIAPETLPELEKQLSAVAQAVVAKHFGFPKGKAEEPDDEDLDDDDDDEPAPKRPKRRRRDEDDDEEEEEEEEEEEDEPAPRPRRRRAVEDDEDEVDPVSARARELKEQRSGKAEADDQFAKFRTAPATPKREDGRKPCRTEPFRPGEHKPTWKDDRKIAAKDVKDSLKFSKRKEPEARRPKAKKVKVVCGKCNTPDRVPVALAPRQIGEDKSTYVCNDCVRKRK